MSTSRDSLGRVGYDLLSRALDECHREKVTGGLRISGKPGGVFHFRDGLVVAVESPGAPGPEARMLRTGRIGGEQWAELLREGEGKRWPETELVAHGYAGAAQLRVVCMMALQDAAFAVVAGRVDDCERLAVSQPFAPVAVGEAPGRLLQDAARKLAAVAALPYPVRPDRERPAPIPGADLRSIRLSAAQRELLAHADGRRTARDIAFATGRAVYTVTVGMARMIGEGLLESTDETDPSAPITVRLPPTGALQRRPPSAPRPADRGAGPAGEPPEVDGAEGRSLSVTEAEELAKVAELAKQVEPEEIEVLAEPDESEESVLRPAGQTPRLAPEVISALASAVGAGAGAAKGADATLTRRSEAETEAPTTARSDAPTTPPRSTPSELPRRKPGASGITETLAPERAGASWKGFFRLRNRIWTPDSGT
ncbi:hypothetical protein [Streptomyces sp. NBC_01236]|uniref:hypothetical protein n=1 Tax=Streptomyces sp. NBC_01236 TaxID=2903789 RepID=UPI002E10A4CD|nr:hypothetical protein OG324_31875 [Streptomyces sp. NBC_01236]